MQDWPPRKKGIFAVVLLAALLLVAILGGGYLGMFSPVHTELGERGPYLIAGLSEAGSYRKLRRLHAEVLPDRLVELGWQDQVGAACAVLEGDISALPRRLKTAKAGYLLPALPAGESGLEISQIPARRVLIATTTAHPAVAGLVVYRKIREYLRRQRLQSDPRAPVVEIYGADGLVTVEVPLLVAPQPITPPDPEAAPLPPPAEDSPAGDGEADGADGADNQE